MATTREGLRVECPACGHVNSFRVEYHDGSRQFRLFRGRREVTYGALRGLPVECSACRQSFSLRARRVPRGVEIETSAPGSVTRITDSGAAG